MGPRTVSFLFLSPRGFPRTRSGFNLKARNAWPRLKPYALQQRLFPAQNTMFLSADLTLQPKTHPQGLKVPPSGVLSLIRSLWKSLCVVSTNLCPYHFLALQSTHCPRIGHIPSSLVLMMVPLPFPLTVLQIAHPSGPRLEDSSSWKFSLIPTL